MVNETGVERDRLSMDVVRRTLSSELVGRRLCLRWEVSSTNEVLRQMAAAGAPAGTVVVAEGQRSGRDGISDDGFLLIEDASDRSHRIVGGQIRILD